MWPTKPEVRHWALGVVVVDDDHSCFIQNWVQVHHLKLVWGCGTI